MSVPFGAGNRTLRQIETAKRGNLDRIQFVQDWITAGSVSRNPAIAASVEQFLNFHAAQSEFLGRPFYPLQAAPDRRDLDGPPVGLGHDWHSRLPLIRGTNDLTRPVAVFGATGTGKSTLLALFVYQVHSNGPKLILVDNAKPQWRNHAAALGATVINLVTDWPCNPCEIAPELTPHEAIAILADCMALSFGWMVASQSLFVEVVHELFSEFGAFQGSRNYPTLRDIRNRLASKKFHPSSRVGGYIQTILNRLDAMLREIPQNYDFVQGVPIERLANQHIVLEVAGLNDYHARFRVLHFLYTLFRIRQKRGGSDGRLLNLAVIDEASSWFAPKIQNDQVGATLLDKLVSQSRASGLGFVFASQGVCDIDPTVLKNAETKIVMRLGDGLDADRIAQSISLDPEQRAVIPRLGMAEAICALPATEPVLMTIPNIYGG